MSTAFNPLIVEYWQRFRRKTTLGDEAPYDVFKIGNTAESADQGLRLILDGIKTTTSSLPEAFSDKRPPQAGDLSIVTDGKGSPGCVIETTRIELLPFNQISADFAWNYGEWDRTLETWRKENGAHYRSLCGQLGINWFEDRSLICETFRVVHVA